MKFIFPQNYNFRTKEFDFIKVYIAPIYINLVNKLFEE